MLERGVRLLLHTRFVDVIERDGRLAEGIVAGPSGPEALRAHCFVDSTDDGLVAEAAGYAVEKGRAGGRTVRAALPSSVPLPGPARRPRPADGRPLHVSGPARVVLRARHHHLLHDGPGRRHRRAMAASRGTDAADIEPLEVRRAVERRGAHLAVDEAPPPAALTPGSTGFFAAPPIANTLIQWTIGN